MVGFSLIVAPDSVNSRGSSHLVGVWNEHTKKAFWRSYEQAVLPWILLVVIAVAASGTFGVTGAHIREFSLALRGPADGYINDPTGQLP